MLVAVSHRTADGTNTLTLVPQSGSSAGFLVTRGLPVVAAGRPPIDTAGLWVHAVNVSDKACAGNVNRNYLSDPGATGAAKGTTIESRAALAAKHHTTVAVLYSLKESRRGDSWTPQGFVMAMPDSEGIYLDVICATPGYGRPLLEAFMHFVHAINPRAAITLSALPTVLTYYPAFGFNFRKNCSDGPIEFPPKIAQRLGDRRKAKTLPKNISEAYMDPDVSDALLFLQENQLNVYKAGPCGSPKISKSSIRKHDCGLDGYTMKKCPIKGGGKKRIKRHRRSSRS